MRIYRTVNDVMVIDIIFSPYPISGNIEIIYAPVDISHMEITKRHLLRI